MKEGDDMEAVTIGGIAVVLVGGFYSVVDLLNDFGIRLKKRRPERESPSYCGRNFLPTQKRIKKMTGVYV